MFLMGCFVLMGNFAHFLIQLLLFMTGFVTNGSGMVRLRRFVNVKFCFPVALSGVLVLTSVKASVISAVGS